MSSNEVVREAQTVENYQAGAKQKAAAKLSRIPVKVEQGEMLKKPEWIRVKAGSPTTRFYEIKQILRESNLHTVCEEASCPNIGECFGKGTATFMIMGDKCTRRCPFCDVGHGRPDPLDAERAAQPGADHRPPQAQVRGDHLGGPRRPARRRRRGISSTASAPRASCRPAPRSKCWCRISAAATTARWRSSRPRRRT